MISSAERSAYQTSFLDSSNQSSIPSSVRQELDWYFGKVLICSLLYLISLAIAECSTSSDATIFGKVTNVAGEVVLGNVLTFTSEAQGSVYEVTINSMGSFQLTVPPGKYNVSVGQGDAITPRVLKLQKGENRTVLFRLSSSSRIQDVSSEKEKKLEQISREVVSKVDKDSLGQIRDYQIELGSASDSPSSDTSLEEMVNPFYAKRSGRVNGSVYWFHRNDNFDARNFFDPVGEALPEYKRNQYGLSLGTGVGERVSLFGSFESLRIVQGLTLLSHVPTREMKLGDFSSLDIVILDPITGQPFPGKQIPQKRLHQVSKKILPVIPDPNRSDPDRNYVNNQPRVLNQDSYLFRFDYEADDDAKTYFQYSLSESDRKTVHPLPSFGSDRIYRSQYASLSHNRKMGSRWVTQGSLSFNRYLGLGLSPNAGKVGLLESLGIAGLATPDPIVEGYPEFAVSGYASFGDGRSPYKWLGNNYSVGFSATRALGDHTLTVGTRVTMRQINDTRNEGGGRGNFEFSGFYTGDGFADFILGLPSQASRVVGSERIDLRRNGWRVYLRDRWRLNPILALTGGVSYQYNSPYRSVTNNVSGFFPLFFEPSGSGKIVIAGSPEASVLGLDRAGQGGMVFPDRNDWAPQVGLSYNPFSTNRLVLAASYSVYYSPVGGHRFSRYLGKNFPFYYIESAHSPVDNPDLDLSIPFEAVAASELVVRGIETELRTPYVQRWSLSLQNDFMEVWELQASYSGNKSTGWSRILPGNVPLPAPGPIQPRRPNAAFGQFQILTGASSRSGHRMNLSAERRLSDGLSLRSGFTWNRSLDDRYHDEPSNPRNLRAERASASGVPTRQFTVNYILDLPPGRESTLKTEGKNLLSQLVEGWRLSGITRIQDGTPFSVYVPGDGNNDGVGGDRADRVAVTSGFVPSIDLWFPVEDFSNPDSFSFGNSGRNILRGPGYQNWDISLIKQTRLTNGDLVELRVELFNAFNKVNFFRPNAVVGTSLFGKVSGAHRSREIEVAFKYSF